jgi:CheY-like chemotaxis protein/signal transduction histidine kinase
MTSGEPLRILCIEDNPVNWRLVQRLLSQAGYQMHWAPDGTKGFELALTLKPALILLDLNLPGLSGFEVATKLRQVPELRQVPLVALTARTLKSDRETALVAGCDGFIPKPLDPFTFVSQVGAYLGGAREQLDQAQERVALRHFNRHMLEHLEAQLAQAQEANRKLTQAQEALETRNRSLARLLALSQSILVERDPDALMLRVLAEARSELHAGGMWAYRMHPGGGYFDGLRWTGTRFDETPVLPLDHPFALRARALPPGRACRGEDLKGLPVWEEGLGLGFWSPASEACMLVLRDHKTEGELFGFWIVTRPGDQPLLPAELEMVTLHASLALVSLENAELIGSLNDSTRALASSYERLEAAYQDLQSAKNVLKRRDRQELLGNLTFRIVEGLEAPVATLHRQSELLDRLMGTGAAAGPGSMTEAQPRALAELREAVFKIDGLLKALVRRVGRTEPSAPEWIDLHDLLQQELGLLQVEGVIPARVALAQDLQAAAPMIYGVYGDFASALVHLVQHALGGPSPSATLEVRTRRDGDDFFLEVRDEGGPVPPSELAMAFEPFSGLHQMAVLGARSPGEGLAAGRQLLAPYRGEITLENQAEGTLVRVRLPLQTQP